MSHIYHDYQCLLVRTSTCRKIISIITLFCFCLMTMSQSFAMTNQENDSFSTTHFSRLTRFSVAVLSLSACASKAYTDSFDLSNLGNRGINVTYTTNYNTGLGYSVSGTGDVNGDGYADMLLGGSSAYLIYGSNNLTNIDLDNLGNKGINITGSGYLVSGAGDVNGDDYLDMLIWTSGDNDDRTGMVYLVYGSNNLTNINLADLGNGGITFTSTYQGGAYGSDTISAAGDVNKDGYADILIGNPSYNGNTGIAYLIYGSSNLTNIDLSNLGSKGINFTRAATGSETGLSVSGAGDVNGDGYDDMLIGANEYSGAVGVVYLIYGSNNLTNINLFPIGNNGISITGGGRGYNAGASISGAGDVNKDGYADILLTSSAGYTADTGIAYLIYGSNNLGNIDLSQSLGKEGISMVIPTSMGSYSISGAGDVNGDGYPDMLIGASGYGEGDDTGIAYIMYGGRNLTNINLADLGSNGFNMTGIPKSGTGASVSGAGDVNNDGYMDMLIGAPNLPSAYLIYGAASGFITPSPTIFSTINPTIIPSVNPTIIPSLHPTDNPTVVPSVYPTDNPTIAPTIVSSGEPNNHSTVQPSRQPTDNPTDNQNTQLSGNSTNKTSSTLPNKLYIITPIVAFFVGMPMIVFIARYINGIYKNKAANLDTESQSTTEKSDALPLGSPKVEMIKLIGPVRVLSDKV